ncbi:VOC family protein [Streptomyces sp. NBC_01216]|uniref:VOC family protein n=1 Tax=unclassified Streptomyces TaxID=2593676 RepID=UPI002E145A5C|nr:VOC family protein [Streptomyces sp. NBC_01216]
MSVTLDHTVVHARDKHRSALFLATILGVEVGAPFGPFVPLDLANRVTLDFYEDPELTLVPQHFAFLVPEGDFDTMIARLEAAGVTYFADPHHTEAGRVNHLFGGRGAYFADPDGHNMEIITHRYTRPAAG